MANVRLLLIANRGTNKKIIGVVNADGTMRIPMFEESTEDEKRELAAQYSTRNDTKKNKIKALLKEEEQDPLKLLAAYNAIVAIENIAKTLESKFDSITFSGDTPLSGETGETIVSKMLALIRALSTPTLSDNPTKEEILRVKLIYNIVTTLSDAIKSFVQDENGNDLVDINIGNAVDDPLVLAKLAKILVDAEAAIAVANLNGNNGDLLKDFNIGSLINAINDADKAAKSGSKAAKDEAIDTINNIVEENRLAIQTILTSYIGIKKVEDTYVYDASLNDANEISNEITSQVIAAYLSISYLAGEDEDSPLRGELSSETLAGLDGLINYSLSFLLDNIDQSLIVFTDAYNDITPTSSYTVKALMDAYLANHTAELDAIFGSGNIDVSLFYEDAEGTVDPIIVKFQDGPDFDPITLLENLFTVTDGHIVELENFIDNCIQIHLNTEGGLGVLAEKFDEAKEALEDLDLDL